MTAQITTCEEFKRKSFERDRLKAMFKGVVKGCVTSTYNYIRHMQQNGSHEDLSQYVDFLLSNDNAPECDKANAAYYHCLTLLDCDEKERAMGYLDKAVIYGNYNALSLRAVLHIKAQRYIPAAYDYQTMVLNGQYEGLDKLKDLVKALKLRVKLFSRNKAINDGYRYPKISEDGKVTFKPAFSQAQNTHIGICNNVIGIYERTAALHQKLQKVSISDEPKA